MPFFFVPLTGLAMASVEPEEMASAAGLMSFMRTLSGAFATSLVTTAWEDKASYNHADLVGSIDPGGDTLRTLQGSGMSLDAASNQLNQLLQSQSIMLSTNQIFWLTGLSFVVAACAIWLAPAPPVWRIPVRHTELFYISKKPGACTGLLSISLPRVAHHIPARSPYCALASPPSA
jgi:DHA2 family multidrug resistance protein